MFGIAGYVHMKDAQLCLAWATACVFTPGRYQHNAQMIWTGTLTEIRVAVGAFGPVKALDIVLHSLSLPPRVQPLPRYLLPYSSFLLIIIQRSGQRTQHVHTLICLETRLTITCVLICSFNYILSYWRGTSNI